MQPYLFTETGSCIIVTYCKYDLSHCCIHKKKFGGLNHTGCQEMEKHVLGPKDI